VHANPPFYLWDGCFGMQLTFEVAEFDQVYAGDERAFQTVMMRLAVDAGWKVGRVTPFESGGIPDIVIVNHGRTLFVEFKLDDGYLRPDQKVAMDWLVLQRIECRVVTPKRADSFLRDIGVSDTHIRSWRADQLQGAPTKKVLTSMTAGSPPFGYRVASVNGRQGYVECASQGPIVRLIFRMAAQGHSLRDIAKTINAGPAIRSRAGPYIAANWDNGRVHKILNSKCYSGYKRVNWGSEVHEWTDAYPRLDGKG